MHRRQVPRELASGMGNCSNGLDGSAAEQSCLVICHLCVVCFVVVIPMIAIILLQVMLVEGIQHELGNI